jgi:hypothetical protein
MKRFGIHVWNDLKRLFDYQVVQITLVLSLVFALMMALMPQIDVIHFVALSVFIVPVIMLSIAAFLRKEEGFDDEPVATNKRAAYWLGVHACSAIAIETIPFVLYSFVLLLFRTTVFSYGLYIVTYFSGALLHVLIALYLAMSAKNPRQLAYGYIVYVLVFSITPILYSNGIIPYAFQYWMLISPAYVSGLLIDNVLTGVQFSSDWLILLASLLQAALIVSLSIFALIPLYRRHAVQAESSNSVQTESK